MRIIPAAQPGLFGLPALWGTVLLILLGVTTAPTALAGESGQVTCTAPRCGYATELVIGGGRASPAITGYCPAGQKFVRLKLTNWEEYRRPHRCPGCGGRLKPVYDGPEVAGFPCPRCGRRTLRYQRRMMLD